MNEMVERVAWAMLEGLKTQADEVRVMDGCLGHETEPTIDGRVDLRMLARAAVAAMREPTEAMVEAGWPLTGDPCWEKDLARAWTRMVDTALAD